MSGHYEPLEVVGTGGFGEVVRARLSTDAGFSRIVALKWLPDEVDEAAVEQLRHEARCLACVQHRAVVHVDRVERIGDRWALVMEFVPGLGLGHALALGPVPPRAALQLTGEVAGALHAAWSAHDHHGEPQHLLHRDIKPGNLRITASGAVKVLDFGLARSWRTDLTVETSGSEGYCSPERLRGIEGPKDDVYALGCVLYEMLSGETFGQAPMSERAHGQRLQTALGELPAGVTEQQRQLLATLLAFDPDTRPDARTLERRCDEVAGTGISLREWTDQAVAFLDRAASPGASTVAFEQTIDAYLGTIGADASPNATVRPARVAAHATLPPLSTALGGSLVVHEVLGVGGMGVVHRGEQAHLARDVAVKRPHDLTAAAGRVVEEARTLGRLDHPNVIPVYALGVEPSGQPALVMKKVDGVTWAALAADPEHPRWRRRPEADDDGPVRHVAILLEVCRGIAFAHERDVLHLDLKPDNVMIGGHGQVYVVDWGLATPLGATVDYLLGSPSSLAPELLSPGTVLDSRTDVFGLGATLHHVLTGHVRHRGAGVRATLEAAAACEPVAYGPDVPAELAALCNRATARQPSDRYATVGELVGALMDWRRHRGSIALAAASDRERDRLIAALDQEEIDVTDVADAFGSARFGYRQALTAWPDNGQARAGLVAVLELMARRALATNELRSAEARIGALEGLGEDPEGLRQDLDRATSARLLEQRVLHDQDLGVGHRQRLAVVGGVAAIALTVPILLWGLDPSQITLNGLLLIAVVMNTALWITLFIARRRLLETQLNRRFSIAFALVVGTVLVRRAVAVLQDPTPAPTEVVADDLMLLGFTSTAAVSLLDRRLMALTILLVLGGALAHLRPEWAFTLISVLAGPIPMIALVVLLVTHARGTRASRPANSSGRSSPSSKPRTPSR
jgi:serine/threonine-protein kinase